MFSNAFRPYYDASSLKNVVINTETYTKHILSEDFIYLFVFLLFLHFKNKKIKLFRNKNVLK